MNCLFKFGYVWIWIIWKLASRLPLGYASKLCRKCGFRKEQMEDGLHGGLKKNIFPHHKKSLFFTHKYIYNIFRKNIITIYFHTWCIQKKIHAWKWALLLLGREFFFVQLANHNIFERNFCRSITDMYKFSQNFFGFFLNLQISFLNHLK